MWGMLHFFNLGFVISAIIYFLVYQVIKNTGQSVNTISTEVIPFVAAFIGSALAATATLVAVHLQNKTTEKRENNKVRREKLEQLFLTITQYQNATQMEYMRFISKISKLTTDIGSDKSSKTNEGYQYYNQTHVKPLLDELQNRIISKKLEEKTEHISTLISLYLPPKSCFEYLFSIGEARNILHTPFEDHDNIDKLTPEYLEKFYDRFTHSYLKAQLTLTLEMNTSI